MLTFFGRKQHYCDGVSRRDFLRVGALTVGGLTMADMLRLQAQGAAAGQSPARGKSVIMIYLPGGPTHLDTYDMKPAAAREFRGELNPINTNVPGVEICELMPRQAKIMDKLAILRGVKFIDQHSAHQVMTGYEDRVRRPCFGSMVSYYQGRQNGLPPYVSLMNNSQAEDPEYCGAAHRPFVPSGPGLDNLSLVSGVSLDRLDNRKDLLKNLDNIRREVDYRGAMTGIDGFTTRALDMITTKEAREAFDVEKEPQDVRERYGRENRDFLRARRLVEAGVSVVTLATGGWDTHGDNFNSMRQQLPRIDQGIHALVTDLHDRGLDKDVAVVMWGEFGRTPRINGGAGRDHWARSWSVVVGGAGFTGGTVVGKTNSDGTDVDSEPYSAEDLMASVCHSVGISLETTFTSRNGRPMKIANGGKVIKELFT